MDNGFAPLKEPKSYDEQIELLERVHGLIIPDRNIARHILSNVNCYRLSAYGIGLMDKNTDRYLPGITIDHLYSLYCFDARLRNALNPVIETIEIRFRAQIAYHLAMTYGAEGYRDRNNFQSWFSKVKQKDMHQEFCDKIDEEIHRQQRKPFVQHHMTKYGGHFPIWVAVELMSLGTLSTLYSIMKSEDETAIARLNGTSAAYMKSLVRRACRIAQYMRSLRADI